MQDLNQRQKDILRSIVNLYVLNATPVGSRTLSKHLQLEKLSPATIRNVMSDLEEMEYITHPHTSAGRIPTDKGYRFYVDTLRRISKLPKTEYAELSKAVAQHQGEDQALQEASKVLGAISKHLAVVRMPQLEEAIIERIEILRLSSTKILVVLQMKSDLVNTVTLEADYSVPEKELREINSFINERISGHSISYVKANFSGMMEDFGSGHPLVRIFTDSVDSIFRAGAGSGTPIYTAGFKELLNQPEFADVSRIKGVIELMEDSDTIVHLIDGSEINESGDPSVLIGRETGKEDLQDYSIVMSRYKLDAGSGAIGLIGPKRMDYARMLSIIKAVSDLLSTK